MTLLLLIGIGITIFLVAVAWLSSPDEGVIRHCNDDIPCQECGQCYGDHINRTHVNGHVYVYPRDLHR